MPASSHYSTSDAGLKLIAPCPCTTKISDSVLDKSKLLQIFIEECDENLRSMETDTLCLEADLKDKDALSAVFRAIHSIKGGAMSFGMSEVASFSHSLEEMLDGMRKGSVPVTGERTSLILAAADCLKKMLAAQKGQGEVDPSVPANILVRIYEISKGKAVASPAPVSMSKTAAPHSLSFANGVHVKYHPNPLCLSRGEDPLLALGKFSKELTITSLKARSDDLPPLNQLSPDICYMWWEIDGTSGLPRELLLRNIAGMVGGGIDVQITASVEDPLQTLSDCPGSLLGSILVEDGLVDEGQLTRVLANQPIDKKLGEALIEEGMLTPLQLGAALEKQKAISRGLGGSSVKVDSQKLDRLVNLSGELTITRSLLSHGSLAEYWQSAPGMKEAMERLERHSRDLQETAMSLRMLPVGNVFNRFPRMVRDVSAMCRKKAILVIAGENTELDKAIIEHLGDPLTHILRNAIDHGVEPPDVRVAKGKPEAATIRLKAWEEAGTVVISVEDDGRGLDQEAILERARSVGLLKGDDIQMSEQQIYSFIFEPGFSTSSEVSDISGRGVGLDVVKKTVESLGGTIGISTRPGAFTRFVLRLPLTMAIIDGQLVRVGDERFVIPVTAILESKRPLPSEIKTVQGTEEVLFWRDGCIPLIRLYETLGGNAWETEPSNALVVIIEVDDRCYALMVDDVLEQQPLIIKGLGDMLNRTPGIAGASILGDGSIVLILDIPGVIAYEERREHAAR